MIETQLRSSAHSRLLMCVWILAGLSSQAAEYTPIELTALGGSASEAVAINGKGLVVGKAQAEDGSWHACLWKDGQPIDLGTLGGKTSEALDINDAGQIVGWADDGAARRQAFLWADGAMKPLSVPGDATTAAGINNVGQIVGVATVTQDGQARQRAFLWENGQFKPLGKLESLTQSAATAINDRGVIVGYSFDHDSARRCATLWLREMVFRMADTLQEISMPAGINNQNEATLNMDDGGDRQSPFYWSQGDIDILPVGRFSGQIRVRALNNGGQLVGDLSREGGQFACIWQRDEDSRRWELTELNYLVGVDAQWDFRQANDVNDLGQIVGWFAKRKLRRAFLLSPAGIEVKAPELPEPTLPISFTIQTFPDIERRYFTSCGINDAGQFFGSKGDAYAFWDGEKELAMGSSDAYVYGMNNQGQVVGHFGRRDYPFLWQAGEMTNLRRTPSEPPNLVIVGKEARDINDSGWIVGACNVKSKDGDWIRHACLWRDGKVRLLTSLMGRDAYCEALAINDAGHVVGISRSNGQNGDGSPVRHAVLWKDGQPIDLGALHDKDTAAADINNKGQIIGATGEVRLEERGEKRSFLWQDGQMIDLGTLGGDDCYAFAIDDSGQIVGRCWTAQRDAYGERIYHGFLWRQGELYDLNELIPDRKGHVVIDARDINVHGQIIGIAQRLRDDSRSIVVLTPTTASSN